MVCIESREHRSGRCFRFAFGTVFLKRCFEKASRAVLTVDPILEQQFWNAAELAQIVRDDRRTDREGVRGDQGKTVVRIMTWEGQDTNDQIAAAMKPFEAENPTSSSRSSKFPASATTRRATR